MARYFDVHPVDPQPRAVSQVVAMLRDGARLRVDRMDVEVSGHGATLRRWRTGQRPIRACPAAKKAGAGGAR